MKTGKSIGKRPWHSSFRWSVLAEDKHRRGSWVEVHSVATKAEAEKLAKQWAEEMKVRAEVVRGSGHKDVRSPR